jgi:hypothetical protein
VQSWRTTQFADEHEDSIITVTLEEVEDGTVLTLAHTTCRMRRRVTSRVAGKSTISNR